MAQKKEPTFSQGTRDSLVKTAVYVGGGLIVLKEVKRAFFGGPGPTTRVPLSAINYHNTQVRKFITNSPNVGDYVEIDDPWTPVQLANELHTAMSGVNRAEYGETERSKVWLKLAQQGQDRVKWLHNYWLDKIDPVDTLYRWLDWEIVLRWSEEHDRREQAKTMLQSADVGF
jgi:hypothetical protein